MKFKTIFTALFLTLAVCLSGQAFGQKKGKNVKKVAILEIIDKKGEVSDGVKLLVRGYMTEAVTMTLGYEGYDRVDVSSILGEQDFQRTGMVSSDQIKQLGEMSGADYIMTLEMASLDAANYAFSGKIIEVETAKITNAGMVTSPKEVSEYENACRRLAQKLFGGNTFMDGSQNKYAPAPKAAPAPAPAPALAAEPAKSAAPKMKILDGADYIENTKDLGMKMVFVKGGNFDMGCTYEQKGCARDEEVTRKISLQSFYIGETEVTWHQWYQIMDNRPDEVEWSHRGSNEYPVYNITWAEAMEFCNKLSARTGKDYTLPTEAQWEYAARGGNKKSGFIYSGNNNLGVAGWAQENSEGKVHKVKGLRPNALGIYDMSGNLWEMCTDWYAKVYDEEETVEPVGPAMGTNHVIRGGAWNAYGNECRVSKRAQASADEKNTSLGFRVIMIP